MEFLRVDSLDVVREKMLLHDVGSQLVSRETVTLGESLGRIVSDDVFSPVDIPSFRRSTVDGYAVLSGDTAAAGESIPVFLTLKGQEYIGTPAQVSVESGECVEVPTGGMLPDGADAMVMWEYTEPFGDEGIAVSHSVAYGENVVLSGEDAKASDLLLRGGKRILPQDIGVLAAAGITSVPVYTSPRLTIVSTGDELVSPEQEPGLGQIRDINSSALTALAQKHGFTVIGQHVLPDCEDVIEQAVSSAMNESNIVIVSGGSSKGKKDLTRPIFDKLSSQGVFTHGIAIKPGKPTILAYDRSSSTLLVGLPGHPVSAMMIFELLIGWLLREYTGSVAPPSVPARILCNLAASPGKLTCQPCSLQNTADGYVVEPVFGKSGLITTLTQANGYFIIDRDSEGLQAGQTVMVNLY